LQFSETIFRAKKKPSLDGFVSFRGWRLLDREPLETGYGQILVGFPDVLSNGLFSILREFLLFSSMQHLNNISE
jgi:hypothetical protein